MICGLCNKEMTTEKFFSRKSICPACGGDLHICLNCKFFSENFHNKCLEPKAEFQRTRDRANFCDFFVYRQDTSASGKAGATPGNAIEEARKKLDALFKK